MLMIKHCVHSMIEMGHGSIINIGSGVSVLGDLFNPAYSTSKGAVNNLTRNVAASLANEAFDAMPFFRALFLPHTRSEARRVGKGCVRTFQTRGVRST